MLSLPLLALVASVALVVLVLVIAFDFSHVATSLLILDYFFRKVHIFKGGVKVVSANRYALVVSC